MRSIPVPLAGNVEWGVWAGQDLLAGYLRKTRRQPEIDGLQVVDKRQAQIRRCPKVVCLRGAAPSLLE
jgi:hypothetical protein